MIPLNDPDIRRRTRPYVIYALVAVNVLIALYQLTLNGLDQAVFTYRYGVIPNELTSGQAFLNLRLPGSPLQDIATPFPTWATMFSSMFMHGGLMHLGGNMLFLWVFGDNVEDRFGHFKFLLFYLATGVAAVWAQVFVDPSSQIPMVGASGAIAGVLGAYLLQFPKSRVDTLIMVGLIMHVRLPALVLIGGWVVMQAFSGLGSLGVSSAGSGVAYFAHLGGFVAGLAATALYLAIARLSTGPGRRRLGPSQQRYWRGEPIDYD